MDVKTIRLIFLALGLGSILIQASIFGVVADKVPDKDGEVPKLAKERNHQEETVAVRALSLKDTTLQKRSIREDIKENRKKRKLVFLGEEETDRKTWDGARAECKRRGGDLATHLTKEDIELIYSEVIPSDAYYGQGGLTWIGGRSKSTSANYQSSFEWVDGGRISADDGNWEEDEPDKWRSDKCMCTGGSDWKTRKDGTKGHQYVTWRCGRKCPFLCQL